jgi:hypothetical protein
MPQTDRPKAKGQDPRATSHNVDPGAKGHGADATGKGQGAARARRDDGFDPTFGIKMDPDEFFEQERRREQIIKMQDVVRPGRTTPIAVRFDQFTLRRLKTLAALHNKGYQTLLKEFVVERLYEEEKRAGIIDS